MSADLIGSLFLASISFAAGYVFAYLRGYKDAMKYCMGYEQRQAEISAQVRE